MTRVTGGPLRGTGGRTEPRGTALPRGCASATAGTASAPARAVISRSVRDGRMGELRGHILHKPSQKRVVKFPPDSDSLPACEGALSLSQDTEYSTLDSTRDAGMLAR